MNKTKQFWTLFKFQTTVNPFIWFMLIAFGAQPLFAYMASTPTGYHTDLNSLLMVQNLFFVYIVGLWIIAPDMAQAWGANASTWSAGTEFLLTRAIDRPLLYRSRAAYLYFAILLIPLLTLLFSLKNPDLEVSEYSKLAQQQCLSHVPGSNLEPLSKGKHIPLISIPGGNVLIEKWHVWLFIITASLAQILLILLYPLKHRTLLFYVIFFIAVFVQVFFILYDVREKTLPYMERLFFIFASHEVILWILTAAIFIFVQLGCERRFAQLEQ